MAVAKSGARELGRRTKAAVLLAVLVAVLTAASGGGGPAPAGALSPPPPNHLWVEAVYQDVLDRAPTAAQRQHRVGQLAAGRSRRAVADELVGSAEHASLIVDRLYRRVLGRAPDGPSRTFWIDQLRSGVGVSTVASFLYGSPELYARGGGTDEGYVGFLYRDVLGREPDAAGADYWAERVWSGENRTGLARSWLLTPEATGLKAGLMFMDLLGRPPTAAEQTDWAGRLRKVDERRVTAALVSTNAYGEKAERPWAPTRLDRGNADSSDPALSADGRIVAFASLANNLTPAGSPAGSDIFVLDRQTGRTRSITAGNGTSSAPHVSADGSTVVFQSAATNLVAGDGNGQIDVFRAPTAGGPIERLTDGNAPSTAPRVSGDGHVVVFTSTASDLVGTDLDGGRPDVFVRTDGSPATLQQVDGDGGDTLAPDVSADGGTLVFQSASYDEELPPQAYLVRLPLAPEPELLRLSIDEGTAPTVSADGGRVAYGEQSPDVEIGSSVNVVDIDGTTITARQEVSSAGLPMPRLADEGGALLLLRIFPAGSAPVPPLDALVVLGGGSEGAFGWDSDLSADGRLVATTLPLFPDQVSHIELYEFG